MRRQRGERAGDQAGRGRRVHGHRQPGGVPARLPRRAPGGADLRRRPGAADDHRRRQDQGLRRRRARVHRVLRRAGQRRHRATTSPGCTSTARPPAPTSALRHRAVGRDQPQLRHRLRHRHPDHHPGAADDHRRGQDQGVRRRHPRTPRASTGWSTATPKARSPASPSPAADRRRTWASTPSRRRAPPTPTTHHLRQRHPDRSRGPADDHGRRQDQGLRRADPAYTASFDGLVNGDTEDEITGLTFTGAPTDADVGDYASPPPARTSPNYAIDYVPGTRDHHPGTAEDHRARQDQGLRRPQPDVHRRRRRPGQRRHRGRRSPAWSSTDRPRARTSAPTRSGPPAPSTPTTTSPTPTAPRRSSRHRW